MISDNAMTTTAINDSAEKKCHHQDAHSLFDLLADECISVIFSFVGGNANENKNNKSSSFYYSLSKAGKFYQQLALVSRSWKRSLDASLPHLITNLEVIFDRRKMDLECMQLCFRWLEKFKIRLAVISFPTPVFLSERIVLIKMLQRLDVTNLTELSIGGSHCQWHNGTTTGDAALQALIARNCRNLRRLHITICINEHGHHNKPSTELFSLQNVTFLSITPVFLCRNTRRHSTLDLSYITRLVESLPLLKALELHGSYLNQAPSSKLCLISKSLQCLHGYNFPNHVRINIGHCPGLQPHI